VVVVVVKAGEVVGERGAGVVAEVERAAVAEGTSGMRQ
jgi:hypothetical protein